MFASDELLTRFARVLPGWFGRCGLRDIAVADAVQEALVAVLEKIRAGQLTFPLDDVRAREELVRVVSVVARRMRRHAQREGERSESLGQAEVLDGRDEAEAVEARLILLRAIERLDEEMRAMIWAHEIEGRTNVEIAGVLKLNEDVVEKRVVAARNRLRSEVEHLEGDKRRRRVLAAFVPWDLGFGDFDGLDRALFGAAYEVTGVTARLVPERRGRTHARPNLPTTALVGALVLVPASSPADEPVSQEKDAFSFTEMVGVSESTERPIPNAFIAQKYPLLPSASLSRGGSSVASGLASGLVRGQGHSNVVSSAVPKVVPVEPPPASVQPTPHHKKPRRDLSDPPLTK